MARALSSAVALLCFTGVCLTGPIACGERFVQAEAGSGGQVVLGTGGRTERSTGGTFGGSVGGGTSAGGRTSAGGALPSGGGPAAAGGDLAVQTGGAATGGSGSGGYGGERFAATFADDFDDGDLDGWLYNPDFFLEYYELTCSNCTASVFTEFQASEPLEASVELSQIPAFGTEMNLALLAQGFSSCDMLEVSYSPEGQAIHVYACWDNEWHDFGSFEQALAVGQRLGARISIFPQLQILVDGAVVDELSIEGYPFHEGALGLSALGSGGFYFDELRAAEL